MSTYVTKGWDAIPPPLEGFNGKRIATMNGHGKMLKGFTIGSTGGVQGGNPVDFADPDYPLFLATKPTTMVVVGVGKLGLGAYILGSKKLPGFVRLLGGLLAASGLFDAFAVARASSGDAAPSAPAPSA